ncbi:sugar kinase [Halobacteriales archaeon QS_1_68_20]|nr:MAG: sugar kinase [Halobacteriales archaeon QS_1_68_20]
MVTVCCAGHVNWDVTLRVDRLPAADGEARIRDQHSSGGGSAANVAAALAGLDLDAGIVGAVGDDQNGLLARRELENAGVNATHLAAADVAPTTVKYLLVAEEGEVAVLGNDGANEALGPGDVDPAYVRGADHVHLTSQRPETAARIAEVAREAGVPVSFDPGRRLPDRDFTETLRRADVVFVNDQEAETLLEAEHDALVDDRVIVVKHGERGAEVHAPDGGYAHPGFEVDPVDTTGAGDAFAAGFVATVLDGGDYERALEFANACGALAAREEGARTAPSRDDVESFLSGQFPA